MASNTIHDLKHDERVQIAAIRFLGVDLANSLDVDGYELFGAEAAAIIEQVTCELGGRYSVDEVAGVIQTLSGEMGATLEKARLLPA